MTAQGCSPDDFVGRVERIEISLDVADYLVAVLELFGRMRGQAMPTLPTRLIAIQRALSDACTGATGTNASKDTAGQPISTGVGASMKAFAALDLSHSSQRRVDTVTAAEMLKPMTKNGVRDRCRNGKKLDWIKVGSHYWITVESIEQYKAQRRPRKRLKD